MTRKAISLDHRVLNPIPGILVCDPIPIPRKSKCSVWFLVRAQQNGHGIVRAAAEKDLVCGSRRPDDPMHILLSANRNPYRAFQFQESLV